MNNIEQILQDLYTIDPKLKEHEEKLRVIISKLLESKPQVEINPEFVEKLRRQLLAQATIQKSGMRSTGRLWKNLSLVFAGTTAAMLLVLGSYYVKNERGATSFVLEDAQNKVFAEQKIENVQRNAFGNLALEPTGGRGGAGGGGGVGSEAAGSGGMGGDAAKSAIYPAGDFVPTNYKFVYTGGDLPEASTDLPVYKRLKEAVANINAGQLLKQMSLGLLDTSKFTNLKIQNLTVAEDREFGYTINVSLPDGLLYIGENWEKWPHPEQACQDEQCYRSYQLKPAQIPGDEQVIAIANQFLKDRSIKLDNYGQPEVQDYWRRDYELAADKASVYIPDALSVIYPLKVSGREVIDEGGNKSGLTVNVNIRHNRVSGVQELAIPHYQSSQYDLETSTQRILDAAAKGGFRSYYYQEPNAKTVEIELGTPTISYMRYYQYKDGKNEDLLVPAYVFPVLKAPEGQNYFQKNVVIPLVKEILDQAVQQPPVHILDNPEVRE